MFCKIFFAPNSPIFLKSRAEEEEREKNYRKALWQTQKTLKVLKHRFQSFKVSLNSKSSFGNAPFFKSAGL